ncbi:MAG: HD-GYP domain-containing protein [Halanaerobiales bacterium]
MRIIPVKGLTPDMELAKPVFQNDSVLLNRGVKNLHKYKEKLLFFGINYVYITDEYSRDIVINGVIKDETRQKGRVIIEQALNDIFLGNDIDIRRIKEVIYEMVDDILSIENVLVNLIDIKSFDSYTFAHSVNVAAISILIGQLLNLPEHRLVELGIGAILHDIGKILIPEEIINKPDILSNEELKIIRDHPRLGYNYLKDCQEISAVSRIIVLLHHERLDGSGYPKSLSEEDIHLFARIVAIADVFDALTTDRTYRKRWSINEVIDYFMSNVNVKFDQLLVEKFIHNIALYPNGMTVILSNGQKAIVKEQNKYFPLRPVLRIVEEADGSKASGKEVINLMNELDIIIIDNL